MSKWLLQEEETFRPSLLIESAARSAPARATYSILLRTIRVLNNRRLFFSADIVVYCVIVDGYPDLKAGTPFWTWQFHFSNVRDGATLPIDPEAGVLTYHGRPRDFLNLYLLVIRDTQSTGEFAEVLKENFIAQGIGMLASEFVSIYAGLPSEATVPATRELTVKAVETTLDYFAQRQNLVIGTYYGSLLRGTDYGLGFHPSNYPESLLNCGGALELAYEVRRE